ncbi:MAG TPA: peptidylprolyl isomerase [Blastocatellia bacterium]|nr:peptidylprolyl isomerase [Blastocatellia bacterium]
MKLFRALLPLGLIFIFTAAASAQEGEAKVMDEVIARVNSAVIMRSDFDKALRDWLEELKNGGLKGEELEKKLTEAKPKILDSLIDQQLLVQRAKDLSIDVEAQVNQQLLRMMKENNIPSVEELEQKMREVGLDINEVRRNIRSAFQTEEVRRREVYGQIARNLTEKEKRDFYDKHTDFFAVPGEVSLSRILIQTGKDPAQALTRAKDITAQARNTGVDFAALARRYSEEELGRNKGGDMGAVKMDLLINEVRDAVAKAPAGTVTDPIKINEGYVIFRVNDRKEPKTRAYEEDEVKQEVMNRLIYEKSQAEIDGYLEKLRGEAFIEIDPRYQMAEMKVKSAQIKRTPYSEESEKERKKREKKEKKEKEREDSNKKKDTGSSTAKAVQQ